jgi:DNA (cytosine-5)-methyltransferase 1
MIPTIDLFAGAGGLSLGVAAAGASVRLLVDLDPLVCETLSKNPEHHGGKVLEADVTTLTGQDLRRLGGLSRRDPLLIVGGPPCQPFSKAAYWTDPGEEAKYRRARARGHRIARPTDPIKARRDPRRSLVYAFWRLVVEANADAFIFENVPSILHPRNVRLLKRLVRSAESARFKTLVLSVNAVDYGVPQRRHRVVVLGLRKEAPPPPQRTHAGCPMTAGEALAPFADEAFFEPVEVVKGRWAEHLKTIPPGWNYKAHTAWAGHPNPTFETETRFWNFLLKLDPARPSWTIAANPGPWVGPFHWDSRRLRTVELAALQAFPPGYYFAGTRRERVRQIGNAVPPLLAQGVAEPLIAALNATSRSRKARHECGA